MIVNKTLSNLMKMMNGMLSNHNLNQIIIYTIKHTNGIIENNIKMQILIIKIRITKDSNKIDKQECAIICSAQVNVI